MTQEELARHVGCTRQTIITLEQGRYVPSLELAFRIARAFGLTVEDVFEYERQKAGPLSSTDVWPAARPVRLHPGQMCPVSPIMTTVPMMRMRPMAPKRRA